MAEKAGQKNVYVCDDCGKGIVTANAVDGTTPYMIGCPERGCQGTARSQFYPPGAQLLRPVYEFYKPSPKEYDRLNEATKSYLVGGAMLLRKIHYAGRNLHKYESLSVTVPYDKPKIGNGGTLTRRTSSLQPNQANTSKQ